MDSTEKCYNSIGSSFFVTKQADWRSISWREHVASSSAVRAAGGQENFHRRFCGAHAMRALPYVGKGWAAFDSSQVGCKRDTEEPRKGNRGIVDRWSSGAEGRPPIVVEEGQCCISGCLRV